MSGFDLRRLHNIHSHGGDVFNVGQPRAGMKYDCTLKSGGVLYLRCDVHPWMAGFVGIHWNGRGPAGAPQLMDAQQP